MLELNRIYNESNLETMRRMSDGFIDLTVTSPPYDNLRTYNGYSFPFEDIAKELYRVTKEGGVVVWNVADATNNGSETGTSFRQALYFMECGFNLHDTMIYAKENPMPLNSRRYENAFEYVFVLSKGGLKTFNPIMESSKMAGKINSGTFYQKDGTLKPKYGNGKPYKDKKVKSNIWFYGVGNNQTGHPAVFPEQLAADHIYSWSNEGDIVYDCFGGSGTTAKMAHKLKREWILSELSKEYADMAQKRIQPYLDQLDLFAA
jgi:DNA modification methylase